METLFCKKCNSEQEYYDIPTPPHISAYCGSCDSFIKHVPKTIPDSTDVCLYFGKYKGTKIKDCTDVNYLKWALENVDSLKPNIKKALEIRIKQLSK
jgi:hypothetical protein